MNSYKTLIIVSILLNILVGSMYLGQPGLQFVLTYASAFIGSILILLALREIRTSKLHILLTLLILILTILTGLPLYLESYMASGYEMRDLGRICYGIGIPLQIALLVVAIVYKKRLNSKKQL